MAEHGPASIPAPMRIDGLLRRLALLLGLAATLAGQAAPALALSRVKDLFAGLSG